MDLENLNTDTVPVWVQFPNLHFSLCDPSSLSKMASYLGALIKTDKLTSVKGKLEYPRMLIDMKIAETVPRFIPIDGPYGLIKQSIHCEWKPIKCCHCEVIGHDEEECKKKAAEIPTAPDLVPVQIPPSDQVRNIEASSSMGNHAEIVSKQLLHPPSPQRENPKEESWAANPWI